MRTLEEPAKVILVVGMNQSDIVSFGFTRLAIVNQEDCQFKFSNWNLDLNVIGGQSEDSFSLLSSKHHMI
jgi:hypothetical protein